MTPTVALIADIVGSRNLANRSQAQDAMRAVFARADRRFPTEQPLWATVGDEFQARYPDLGSALGATALVLLTLPDELDCRFGLGVGEATEIEPGQGGGTIQDGSAWWRAREAITTAHDRQDRGQPSVRTWLVAEDAPLTAAVDALFLQRDHTIARMKARERRLAAGLLEGRTQKELAQEERIAQSAVSQTLHRSGAVALAAGIELFREVKPA
ncbi:SatD family protein [Leifsonia sp. LS-T14]|uniref:SatD family protein n=1 Tax=unclassified Leifsonia TaxID=2663824 RepID=UPI0035A5AB72